MKKTTRCIESLESRAMMDASGIVDVVIDTPVDPAPAIVETTVAQDAAVEVGKVTRDYPSAIPEEAVKAYAEGDGTAATVTESTLVTHIRDLMVNEAVGIGSTVNARNEVGDDIAEAASNYTNADKFAITYDAAQRWVDGGRELIKDTDARVCEESGNIEVVGYLNGANKTIVCMDGVKGAVKTEVFVYKQGSGNWAKESVIEWGSTLAGRPTIEKAYAFSSGIELETAAFGTSHFAFTLRNDYAGNLYTYKVVTTLADGSTQTAYCSFKFGYTKAELAEQEALDNAFAGMEIQEFI